MRVNNLFSFTSHDMSINILTHFQLNLIIHGKIYAFISIYWYLKVSLAIILKNCYRAWLLFKLTRKGREKRARRRKISENNEEEKKYIHFYLNLSHDLHPITYRNWASYALNFLKYYLLITFIETSGWFTWNWIAFSASLSLNFFSLNISQDRRCLIAS